MEAAKKEKKAREEAEAKAEEERKKAEEEAKKAEEPKVAAALQAENKIKEEKIVESAKK